MNASRIMVRHHSLGAASTIASTCTLVLTAVEAWRRTSVRVLPGTHDLGVWDGISGQADHVIFDAEAGETYTVHWEIVEGVDYIWVEDKSRSIVVGEKPLEK